MYSIEQILKMNATARYSGATVNHIPMAWCLFLAMTDQIIFPKPCRVLDFGAGKRMIHTNMMRALREDYQFDAFEIGNNITTEHTTCIDNSFGFVVASNVVNVQPNTDALYHVFNMMRRATKIGGFVLFNYPKSPRHAGLSTPELLEIACRVFDNSVAAQEGALSGTFLARRL